tara:strand:+ start:3717 stop:4313 length:597 start_codon:yes stop_codon:yes gene_type:complete
MGFWTDATLQDPKRAYRFLVTIGTMENGAQWYATKVKKPSFKIGSTEHKFLNHTFHYPTRTEWEEISLTLVDPVSPDAANSTMAIIKASGYDPSLLTAASYGTTTSKSAAVSALGGIKIEQIDSLSNPIETWTLWNPFITGVNLSELSYDSDDMSTIELSFRYDWAYLETVTASAVGPITNEIVGTNATLQETTYFKP